MLIIGISCESVGQCRCRAGVCFAIQLSTFETIGLVITVERKAVIDDYRERKCAENYDKRHNKYIFKLQSAFW